ncbi:hypothetical protein HDU91_002325 [Kappamyces sp. JEL0680]|nr:hypothetical protein HDU91_002325 [Kappamyces sp. JEL0680]
MGEQPYLTKTEFTQYVDWLERNESVCATEFSTAWRCKLLTADGLQFRLFDRDHDFEMLHFFSRRIEKRYFGSGGPGTLQFGLRKALADKAHLFLGLGDCDVITHHDLLLWAAVEFNKMPVLVELMKYRIHLGLGSVFGYDGALRLASLHGHMDMLHVLLRDGRANPSNEQSVCLHEAVRQNNAAVVEVLLADGRVDPAAANNYAWQCASLLSRPDILQILDCDGRVEATLADETTLARAAAIHHFDVALAVLSECAHQMDPLACDPTLLRLACAAEQSNLVRLLLRTSRPYYETEWEDCLRGSVRHGHFALVKLLIQDARCRYAVCYRDCIQLAHRYGHWAIAQYLIDPRITRPLAL